MIRKAHRAQVWEMRETEYARVYRCLPTLVRALKQPTGADAVNLLSLNGPVGGQTVLHLHFHLIPVHRGRPVLRRETRHVVFRLVQRPTAREVLDKVAERIRARLAETARRRRR